MSTALPSGKKQKSLVSKTVWGHVFPDVLLVLGKTSSSIIYREQKGMFVLPPEKSGKVTGIEGAGPGEARGMEEAPALRD